MVRSIYLASSWKNEKQPAVLKFLRNNGFDMYDFRHPADGNDGFSWHETGITKPALGWTARQYIEALQHPVSKKGYGFDILALKDADACVLLMPCGNSAFWELGCAFGMNKVTAVLVNEPITNPELMIRESFLTPDLAELVLYLKSR